MSINAQNLVVDMPRLHADHLEVFEGPRRPSADFFQTRNSTAASPSAEVRSATSASSCCSREDGLPEPAASPARPVSMNCRFQFETDCSDTFDCRAACATVSSPASTASTMRTFSSTGNAVGRAMINSFRVETKHSTSARNHDAGHHDLGDDESILYNQGSIDFYSPYPGMYIPAPIGLRHVKPTQSPAALAREVLALIKMTWNQTRLDSKLPVTLRTAEQVK